MENTNYIEKVGVKAMPWSTFFQRTANIPLDRSSMFGSLEDAKKYAKGDETDPDERNLTSASYVGQILTVYENNKVNVYKITPQRSLELVGNGKGVIVVNDETEALKIANDENTIGQIIFDAINLKLYFVTQKNKLIELIYFINDDVIIDCGEY